MAVEMHMDNMPDRYRCRYNSKILLDQSYSRQWVGLKCRTTHLVQCGVAAIWSSTVKLLTGRSVFCRSYGDTWAICLFTFPRGYQIQVQWIIVILVYKVCALSSPGRVFLVFLFLLYSSRFKTSGVVCTSEVAMITKHLYLIVLFCIFLVHMKMMLERQYLRREKYS